MKATHLVAARRPARVLAVALLLAQLACAPAMAQVAEGEEQSVVVPGIRNPAMKSYRAMLAGLDAFDAQRALAPTAPELRFRLRSVAGNPAGSAAGVLDGVSVRIAGATTSIALPLAADRSFALPRDAAAEDEDAELVLNKSGGFRWDASVHSADVPAGMRRLGDLRLECQVLVAIGKKEMGFVLRAAANMIIMASDWCMSDKMKTFQVTSLRALERATLVAGERRLPLELAQHRMQFYVPLHDRTFPDSALVELEFAPQPVATAQAAKP